MATFTPSQNAFQFFADGTEAGSTALAAQGSAPTIQLATDFNFQLRIRFQENGGKNGGVTDDWQLQYNKGGAGWVSITASSAVIKGFNSASLADADPTTQRLTSGSGSFVAGAISEDGLVDNIRLTSSNFQEDLWSLTLVFADIVDGDSIQFRALINGATMTYNDTPSLTVRVPVTLNTFDAVTSSDDPAAIVRAHVLMFPTAFDALIAYDLTNQELAYWILVTDDHTVVLVEASGPNPSHNETVTIAEDVTMLLLLQPIVGEDLTAVEDIKLHLLILPIAGDDVTVAEDVTMDLLVFPLANDEPAVTDAVTAFLPWLVPAVADSITLVEAITMSPPLLADVGGDDLTLDDFTALNVIHMPNTADDVTIAEDIPLNLKLQPIVDDPVTVEEFIFIPLAFNNEIDVGEDLTVAEDLDPNLTVYIGTFDNVVLQGETWEINTADAVTVADFESHYFQPLVIDAGDLVTVADTFTTIFGGTFVIDVFESVVVNIPETHQFESITVAEDLTILRGNLGANVFESVSLLEVIEVGQVPPRWASLGNLGSNAVKSSGQSSIAFTTLISAPIWSVPVILIAVDNFSPSDGDEGAVTSLTDSNGHTWLKAREFTNGQGGDRLGSTISVWYTQITSILLAGSTITANFSNSTVRDATSITGWLFRPAEETRISVEFSAALANDNADPSAMDVNNPLLI